MEVGMINHVHVKCFGEKCDKTIRISVTTEILGKTVTVGCPDCKTKNRVAIPEKIVDGSKKPSSPLFPDPDPFKDLRAFGDIFGRR